MSSINEDVLSSTLGSKSSDTSSVDTPRTLEGIAIPKAYASNPIFKKEVAIVDTFKIIPNDTNKQPIQVGLFECETSNVAFKKDVAIVNTFLNISKKSKQYSGVYYSTGVKETVYQPRKSPLNWMPQKWNGQDI